ncbi:MAG TPA: biopolymer transporter ExbD [Chitinophagaceae bacterium]|jgi:biopolymer transport protein ExbD|nr:biopolymer transporter ExbD [Chitinophagaceae bacterium]
MTELNIGEPTRNKGGVQRMKKANLKIDMTPMVDLGFLLIAFFIFTTEVSKPAVTNLYMPHEGDSTKIQESKSLTILLGSDDKVFYYFGLEETAIMNHQIYQTSYSEINGLGNVIRGKQNDLEERNIAQRELIVLIKPGKKSSYKNVVDVLDEMLINNVKKYMIADPGNYDSQYLGSH